jgi:hypothetical protein
MEPRQGRQAEGHDVLSIIHKRVAVSCATLLAMAFCLSATAQDTLKAAALLPLEEAPGFSSTRADQLLALDLRQYIAWCACQAKIMRTKREGILPWMKPIAARYGIDRGVYNSQETKDEHLRAIETFLYQAEQIAVGGDPWAGFYSPQEPDSPRLWSK